MGKSFSVYVRKYNRRWIKELRQYVEDTYQGDMDFSEFVVMALKDFINDLVPKDYEKFMAAAKKVAEQENPEAARYAKNFIKEKT